MKLDTNGHAYEVREDGRLVLDLGEGSLGFDSGARMVLFPDGWGHIETTEYYMTTTGKRRKRHTTFKLTADDVATLRYAFSHLATCLSLPITHQCGSCESIFFQPTDTHECPVCGSGNWVMGFIDDKRVDPEPVMIAPPEDSDAQQEGA